MCLERRVVSKAFEYIDRCRGKSKHVSFIAKRNKIVAVGWNNEKVSHPAAAKFGYIDATVHSELMAIWKFPGEISELSKYAIWNVRINRYHEICMSRPCPKCIKLLKHFGIKDCYYTNDMGNIEYEQVEYMSHTTY